MFFVFLKDGAEVLLDNGAVEVLFISKRQRQRQCSAALVHWPSVPAWELALS